MPNFQLLLQTSPIVQIHTYAAIIALFLGSYILWARKGSRNHKNLGKLWVAIMMLVAVSSFWISGIKMLGPFSLIHLLSVLALWSVYRGIKFARNEQIQAHMNNMKSLYAFALIGAGIFTLLPGRVMFNVFFG